MARVLTSDSLLFPAYHAASQNMHVELRHTSKKIMVGGNQKALDTMSLGPCGSRLNCSDRANTEALYLQSSAHLSGDKKLYLP